MAGRRELYCGRCGVQLLVPPGAGGSIRCSVCWAVTPVRSLFDPVGQLHERVRWAKNWVKGLASPMCSQLASFGAGAAAAASQQGAAGLFGPRPPLSYPSVHGSKRALLVGITYRSMRYELKGSINDVNCMKFLLHQKFEFPEQCILVLSEDETDPSRIPTRQNMAAAMRWLLQGCRTGDSLVFHFSGHGSQRIDTNSDELDGYDETLCPLDYELNGMISDDEVHATIVEPLPRGVRLHAVIDACHSGSSLDLPYICKLHRNGFWQWEAHNNKGTRGGLAICFSGCGDDQTSSDTSAFTRNIMTGAMTYCFIQAVESEPGVTYGRMLQSMRTAIREANTSIRIGGPIAALLRKVFQTGLTQGQLLVVDSQWKYSTESWQVQLLKEPRTSRNQKMRSPPPTHFKKNQIRRLTKIQGQGTRLCP